MAYVQKNNPIPKTSCGRRRMERMNSPFDQKSNDNDTELTAEQKEEHKKKVFEYNKNIAKPLNDIQKEKLKNELKKLNPNSEKYKEISGILNLKKNQ